MPSCLKIHLRKTASSLTLQRLNEALCGGANEWYNRPKCSAWQSLQSPCVVFFLPPSIFKCQPPSTSHIVWSLSPSLPSLPVTLLWTVTFSSFHLGLLQNRTREWTEAEDRGGKKKTNSITMFSVEGYQVTQMRLGSTYVSVKTHLSVKTVCISSLRPVQNLHTHTHTKK